MKEPRVQGTHNGLSFVCGEMAEPHSACKTEVFLDEDFSDFYGT